MKKLVKTKTSIALAAAASLMAPVAAGAQSAGNNQLMSGGVMQKFSATDVTSMLGEFEIQAALQPYDGSGMANMLATTAGGAQFIVSLFQCDDIATAQGCTTALVYTAMSNAGVSYDDLNTFHTNADVTRAVNVPAQNIIIFGVPIYAQGGIGRDNFKFLSALFLMDMQGYLESLVAQANTISMEVEEPAKSAGKISNETPAPAIANAKLDEGAIERALSAAVSNTLRVNFKPIEQQAD